MYGVYIMAIKSKDLAKLLGVSTATVSLVINNRPGICSETRKQLIARINELGYGYMLSDKLKEDSSAEDTAQKGNIAYVAYQDCDEKHSAKCAFFPMVLQGAEEAAREHGYNLQILHVKRTGPCTVKTCVNTNDIDGFIVQLNQLDDADIESMNSVGLPYVLIDTYFVDKAANSVCVDNRQGVYKAMDYLKRMGHTKIGYLSSGCQSLSSMLIRREAYKLFLEYNNMPDNKEYFFDNLGYDQVAYDRMKAYIEEGRKLPTAFISDNDLVAWGALKAIKKCGFRVPEEVSIIGFDDREMCVLTEPQLTSVRIPRTLLGRETVEMLVQKIDRRKRGIEDVIQNTELRLELSERESVADLNRDICANSTKS